MLHAVLGDCSNFVAGVAMARALLLLQRVAANDAGALPPGELRTGRALFAQALHRVSAPVVALPLDKSAPQLRQVINH
jgi:DNA-binding NtrC family response regulator